MKRHTYRLAVALLFGLQVLLYPMAATADTVHGGSGTAPSDTSVSSASPATTLPAHPTGPDASTYRYDQAAGVWENDYFTWDPVTKEATPKTPLQYTYNAATGMWDTAAYTFDTANSTYVKKTVSVAQPPAGTPADRLHGGPAAAHTGSTPENTATGTSKTTTTDTSIHNTVTGTAASGAATVSDNTRAGSATSGTAHASTTVVNLLQSTTELQQGAVHTFTIPLTGNTTGDVLLDPAQLNVSTPLSAENANDNLTINVAQNNRITNDISLTAQSGSAQIAHNDSAGNATSGNALAVANVANIISTSITAGQSFIGTINIYGSMDGDILLPDGVQQQLLAANMPTTTIPASQFHDSQTISDLTNATTVTNNISTVAKSGNTTVADNTTAGSAVSGSTQTNLTVLNLTGQQVIGNHAILVFVNVMGKWVGAIINAPQGATAAELGDGSNAPAAASPAATTSITSKTTSTITNNVAVRAASGNASVLDNGQAGSATSGSATAGANILNVTNSSLSLADWFGILFINVFGSWNGSFGVDTAAGGFSTQTPGGTTSASGSESGPAAAPQVKAFAVSTAGGTYQLQQITPPASPTTTPAAPQGPAQQPSPTAVLAATTTKPTPPAPLRLASGRHGHGPIFISIITIIAGLVITGIERLYALRQRRVAPAQTL